MNKKQFKVQASSSRVGHSTIVSAPNFGSKFTAVSSTLSYVYEPPNLSDISASNIVVAFKNLQKKDCATKARALEDLQAYVVSCSACKDGLEDAVLDAWIELYPRTSVENTRRIRQLAHTIQGQIAILCGKRIAKYMPKSIGAWLAGSQDNDKLVARAAVEAFVSVFPTAAKQNGVWRVYQASIIEYCRDALLKETAMTLSDERITSPDDAEAKYARVVGTALQTTATAIELLSPEDVQQQDALYQEIFRSDSIWRLSSNSNAFVRRATYRLMAAILASKPENSVDMIVTSTYVLQGGLHVAQAGSAYVFVQMLVQLTSKIPDMWTKFYSGSGKQSAVRKLCQFLRKGSQGSPPDFWNQVSALLHLIPRSVLHAEQEIVDDVDIKVDSFRQLFPVLASLHDGISRKDEQKFGSGEGWQAYLRVTEKIMMSLSTTHSLRLLLQCSIMPLITQYLQPNLDKQDWVVIGFHQPRICLSACLLLLRGSLGIFDEFWRHLSMKFVESLQISQPEQFEDYKLSQDFMIQEIGRWYQLQASILQTKSSGVVESIFRKTTIAELKTSINLIKNNNGKPYSAAALLDIAVRTVPGSTTKEPIAKEMILAFTRRDLPLLLTTPSSPALIAFLTHFESVEDIKQTCQESIVALLGAPDSPSKSQALHTLISSSWLAKPELSPDLFRFVRDSLDHALAGDSASWSLVDASFKNLAVPYNLIEDLLVTLTENLSIDDRIPAALLGLDKGARSRQPSIKDYCVSPQGAILLSRLLFLAESPHDDISHNAQKLSQDIHKIISAGKSLDRMSGSMIEIVKSGICNAYPTSLSIHSLVEQAEQLFHGASDNTKGEMANALLPDQEQWSTAIDPFVDLYPAQSLAITNELGGAVFLIDHQSGSESRSTLHLSWDGDGYSSALRMAWYTTKLSRVPDLFAKLSEPHWAIIIQNMALFVQVATDNLSVSCPGGLWLQSDNDSDVWNLIAEAQTLIANWLHELPQSKPLMTESVLATLIKNANGSSPAAYYNARAYSSLSTQFNGTSQLSQSQAEGILKNVIKAGNVITAVALLARSRNQGESGRICSWLIAYLTELDIEDSSTEGLRHLVLFNVVTHTHEGILQDIHQQRIVFFVKNMVIWLQAPNSSLSLVSEIYKALNGVLPYIKDIYGSFWREIVTMLANGLADLAEGNEDCRLPLVHASLRLFRSLQSLASPDASDDLSDSLADTKEPIMNSMLHALKLQSDLPDEMHQPRKIVNDLLGRQVVEIFSGGAIGGNSQDLYPILASNSAALQYAAYNLLHQKILMKQEEVSIETALLNTPNVQLPEELLSLVLAAPSLNRTTGNGPEANMPLALRSYLLSWKLIFDHWINASYMVQNEYVRLIKEGSYLNNLLTLTFDFLVGSRNKALDPSQYEIETYDPGTEGSPEKHFNWLLVHLYYLSLKHLPALARAWWRDDCSRQLQKSVDEWTTDHISQYVIQAELSTVAAWFSSHEPELLEIKVSPRVREVIASYPVDEQSMSIRVALPPNYPLTSTSVESIHRVGVDERKWRAWLIATQGIINFASSSGGLGAVIDGLVSWRKNVEGALKGQNECAICYSVISADRQLPTKRCGTCRNAFHGSCLFRWFKSSGSSSCPLCRNAFNYG